MNAITATGTDVLSSPTSTPRRPRRRLVAAAAVLVLAGTATAVVLTGQGGHPQTPVTTV